MATRDLYEILGVEKTASLEEIKRASVDDILGRHADLFGSLFGREFHARRSARQRGRDLAAVLEVDFRTAALGGKVELTVGGEKPCAACEGKGAKGPARPCATCEGRGSVTRQAPGQGQFFSITSTCPDCGGAGTDSGSRCADCHGTGAVAGSRKVTVTVPEGARHGDTLRLRGLGSPGRRGGPPGDLFLDIAVRPDPQLRRDGNDVRSDLDVTAPEAVLGARATVRTLRGEATVEVPAGTSSGSTLRLRGQGIRGGDHLVRVLVSVPRKSTEEQKKLYRRLREIDGKR